MEKEKERLRLGLQGLHADTDESGYWSLGACISKEGMKNIIDFISQELDKAREEGFNDGRKYEVMSRYNDGEFLSDKRKKEFEMLGQKYLSKLKDK